MVCVAPQRCACRQCPNAPAEIDLKSTFDRVVVVNLGRRPDRMARFRSAMAGWPFAEPQRFEAIDGQRIAAPPGWPRGAGAWGCQMSHRLLLDAAIRDGLGSLLVLEDDAAPVSGFAEKARGFFSDVPADWDCLMLGTEHLQPPIPVVPGVVRCVSSIRTHAYAVRGKFMEMLSVFWRANRTDHCDLVLSSLFKHYKVYSPDPLLIGQTAGLSDVDGKTSPARFAQLP